MNTFVKSALPFLVLLASCGSSKEETIQPERKNITESVYASAIVQPEVTYFPQPVYSGIINKIMVQEGDSVEVGSVLFEMSPSLDLKGLSASANINLEQARSNYYGSNNLLTNIALSINNAQQQLLLDSANYARQDRLWSQNIGSQVDYDRTKLKYETTRTHLNNLQLQYEQTKSSLENEYARAKLTAETKENQLADFVVRSHIKGKVYTVFKEEGELIGPQERFAEIGSSADYKMVMDIDEVDIAKVQVNDSVLVTLNAYSEKVFVARVNKIFPKKDDRTQTFRVESVFLDEMPLLYNGLSGEANIVVAQRSNSLVIPSEYLLPGNRVLTKDGEKPVKTGVKNLNFVEIVDGIDENTTLIKPEE